MRAIFAILYIFWILLCIGTVLSIFSGGMTIGKGLISIVVGFVALAVIPQNLWLFILWLANTSMSSRVLSWSLFEKIKLVRLLRPVARRYGHPESSIKSMTFATEILNVEHKSNPQNELILLILSEYYHKLGQHIEALKASREAYGINPSNPRNAYSVASAYNAFTYPQFLNNMDDEDFVARMNAVGFSVEFLQNIKRQADIIGLNPHEAANQAVKFFQETLSHRLRRLEREEIIHTLNGIIQEYPNVTAGN